MQADNTASSGLAVAQQGPRGLSWAARRRRIFIALLAPALVVLFVVTVLPTLYLLTTSFTPLDLTKPGSMRFYGLLNYERLLDDHRFINSLWVQARLSFWTVTLQLLIGLSLAMLLNTRLKFLELMRTAYIIPLVLPPVVVALTWRIIYTPNISILNWLLGALGGPQPAWLTDANLALWAIIIADVWQWFPFVLLMMLAALQMLPEEPLEAAKIDGASYWQVFQHITLPLIKPVILVAGLFRLIDSIKAFPLIYIMTGGGPGVATEPTNYYAYLQAFSYTYIGYSSAVIMVMLIVTLVMSASIIRAVGREVEVE